MQCHDFDFECLIQLAKKNFSNDLRETVMTSCADRLRQEGVKQGMQQGKEIEKQNVAIKLLTLGSDLDLVSKVTGMPLSDVEKLIQKIH